MVGLDPYPGTGERNAPIFFHVPCASGEIHRTVGRFQQAFDAVMYAKHPMVAFHKRNKAIPPHDAGRMQVLGPGMQVGKLKLALNLGEIEMDVVGSKPVSPQGYFEMAGMRLEFQGIEALVMRLVLFPVKHLDKRMPASIGRHADARNDSQSVLSFPINEFKIPSFKVLPGFAPAMVHGGVPQSAPALHQIHEMQWFKDAAG